jgi:hypothetical protein
MAETTLEFLARQQAQMLEELGRQRDDMAVLQAMVQRLDGTVQGLVAELRARPSPQDRQARDLRLIAERLGEMEGN